MERIDWETIKSYKSLNTKSGENLYDSLFEKFKEHIFDDLKLLKVHLENQDFKQFAGLAHKMKSSSGNLGMLSVSSVLNEMEEAITVHAKSDVLYFQNLLDCAEAEVALLIQVIASGGD